MLQTYRSAESSPKEVYGAVRKIYDYRSRPIHGDKKTAERREIALPGNRRERTVNLAVQYLRRALHILLDHPEYLVPRKIDEDLLIGCRYGIS
jgi:hypothetical protein